MAMQSSTPDSSDRHPADGLQEQGVPKRVVAAAVAGNVMEFFDFTTYAFFAIYIGKAFFPAHTPFMSLLLSVAVFGVGFVTRPLGGVLIGAFADRVGRKPALLLTVTLMSVGTLGLAITPSYEQIGLTAPVVVVICRLLQGVALGGEVGPSTSFLIEIAPPGRRGLYGSWQVGSQGMASLCAGIVGVLLTLSLTPAQMQSWGWRVPFLLGLLLIPVALYIRRHMPESLEHMEPRVDESADRLGIRGHLGTITIGLVMIMGTTISTYVAIYMTTYATATLKLAPVIAMSSTVCFGAATWAGAILGGWLSDRYGRKPVILWVRVVLTLVAYPLFAMLIAYPSLAMLVVTTSMLAGLTAISGAPTIVAIPELFPAKVRALGLSVAYAVGVCVFGGSAQVVVTWLIGVTGNPAAPALYVVVTGVAAILGVLAMDETGHTERLHH